MSPQHNPVSYFLFTPHHVRHTGSIPSSSHLAGSHKHRMEIDMKYFSSVCNGDQRSMVSSSTTSSSALSLSLGSLIQPDGLVGEPEGSVCLHLSRAGLQEHNHHRGTPPYLAFCMAAENLDPGPHAWVARALPTDPCCWPLKSF